MRTAFAVTLQVARSLAELQALVHAAHQGDRLGIRRAARAVAVHVLRGARDHSRDVHPRALLDQLGRTDSLDTPRLRPPRKPPPAHARKATR